MSIRHFGGLKMTWMSISIVETEPYQHPIIPHFGRFPIDVSEIETVNIWFLRKFER